MKNCCNISFMKCHERSQASTSIQSLTPRPRGKPVVRRMLDLIEARVISSISALLLLRKMVHGMVDMVVGLQKINNVSKLRLFTLIRTLEKSSRMANEAIGKLEEACYFSILLYNYKPGDGLLLKFSHTANKTYQAVPLGYHSKCNRRVIN